MATTLSAESLRLLGVKLIKISLYVCSKKANVPEPPAESQLQHNPLQGAGANNPADMVFVSPMDHRGVKEILDEHSHVDPDLPFDLKKMPKPQARRQ